MSNAATTLKQRSPLHELKLADLSSRADAQKGVWANELEARGYINIRGRLHDRAFAQTTTTALGVSLPSDPCSILKLGQVEILWISPDEWLIAGPRSETSRLLSTLRTSLSAVHSQVVDNAGGYTEIAIAGRDAEIALSHCTVYNLHALTPGRAVGTTFGKTSINLRRNGHGFTILVRRSFAEYVWRYLERASQPYGFGVANLEPTSGDHS